MLKTYAVALLAITMSVGLAEAKEHKLKTLPYCQNEQQTKETCACGPAKTVCPKGMWGHAFASICRP